MANKHSIMTREMVESFCNSYYIPDEVHPTAPGRDRTITQFPEGKVGVYTRLFDYCGYRIPFTKFFVAVLKHFRIHISQLSPFGAARVSHFEVLTRVLNLAPSVAVFRAFYTRIYSDGLFSFAKRSLSAPSCLSKPPDSIKNWADHFFWVDSKVFPISVPLYMGGVLEKDPAPHLTARQEQAVQVLSTNKAPFRRYPECFLVLVGLSPYYPFDENTYRAFERPDKTDMGLLDYIRTADPRKVQAVEVRKGEEQVKLLDSIKYCFVSLDTPAVAQQEGGSGSGAGPEVLAVAKEGDATRNLASGTGGKTLASLRRTIPEGSLALGPSFQADVHAQVTVRSSRVADAPVYTAADTVTSSRGKTHAAPTSDVGGSSQLETSEGSADSFYETAALNSEDAKRWSRTEHELELREKLRAKYDAQGVLLKEKDVEIARLKSLVEEKETESAEVSRLRDQVSVLTAEKSFLSAEVSALKSAVSQKETDISLLYSRATYLKSALDDSQAACAEARNLISALSSERDGLASEVSTLHSAFRDFKEKIEAQQEAQAQVLYNRVAELEGEFYPAYLTALARRRWLLTHGVQLAMVKCLKSPEYQGILGHALGRAVDFGMQEGLAAGHEHGVARTPLFAVTAYNPETAEANYLDAVRALEEADFHLVHLLKSKKDFGMDEVLDCFLLDGPLVDLPEAAHLQLCIEQLSVPIYHADVKAVVAALCQLMVDIISHPLSFQNLVGEARTSAATLSIEDLDTDEDLGRVVCMPQFEDPCFEILQ
ncbi:hypothetical protein Tco_0272287 [Tanacetum coccineum]